VTDALALRSALKKSRAFLKIKERGLDGAGESLKAETHQTFAVNGGAAGRLQIGDAAASASHENQSAAG
jgi:hypothetical protein